MTLKERYIRYFTESLGCRIVEARTTKYTVLQGHDVHGQPYYIFLGSHGAVRYGRVTASTQSIAYNLALIRMQRWEEDKGYKA